MALYGFQILSFLNKNIKSKNIILCSYDNLPYKVKAFPSYYVVNLDTSNGNGSHWIAIYFNKKRQSTYFCSFRTQPNKIILNFLKMNSTHINFSYRVLQNYSSHFCGYYVCFFLITCYKYDYVIKNKNNNSLELFYSLFSNNLVANDLFVTKMCNMKND
jgi:hypothetical protein